MMKRIGFILFALVGALLLGSCSTERQVEKLREKIRFVSLDEVTPHGFSSVDAVATVVNETRHKITVEAATLVLHYRDNSVAMLQLRDELVLPKRFDGQLAASARMKLYDPLSAVAILARVRNRATDDMKVTIEAKVKVGPVRKNILIKEMELQKFLSKFATSADEVDEI